MELTWLYSRFIHTQRKCSILFYAAAATTITTSRSVAFRSAALFRRTMYNACACLLERAPLPDAYIYIYLLWARARPQFFWLLSQNFHVGEASVLYLWCACETTGYLGFEMSPRAYTFDSRVVCRSPRVCERMNEWVSELWTRPVYSHNEHHVHALHIIHSTCLHYTYYAVLCMSLFDGCFTPDSWILNQNGLRILISIITVAIPYTPEYRSTLTH